MSRRDKHHLESDHDFDYLEDLERSEPRNRKKAIANKRRIDEILENRKLEEDIGDIEYLLSHRNRNKISKRDRKRR